MHKNRLINVMLSLECAVNRMVLQEKKTLVSVYGECAKKSCSCYTDDVLLYLIFISFVNPYKYAVTFRYN